MRRLSVLVVLAGCDFHFVTFHDDTGGSGTETATETATDTTSGTTCSGDVPADTTVAADTTCMTPTDDDLSLVTLWSAPLDDLSLSLHAVRTLDTNGDGTINAEDSMQVWVPQLWGNNALYAADGTQLYSIALGDRGSAVDVADIDPASAGDELLAVYGDPPGEDTLSGLALLGADAALWSTVVDVGKEAELTLTDLEGDGTVEALVGNAILDAATGARLGTLAGIGSSAATHHVAADLDRDGVHEIIGGPEENPTANLYNADGTVRANCIATGGAWGNLSFAVGNLDDDEDGEFVVAGDGFVAICDTDGTLLTEADVDILQPEPLGLGQLDDDPEPELVVATEDMLLALDLDLSVKWTYSVPSTDWYPFSLADLTGDGQHEILLFNNITFSILDGDGTPLATAPIGTEIGTAWLLQPIVVDIDADGLAEIVVGGPDSLTVFENAEGGWAVPGADEPWHGLNRAPGDRDAAGAIPAPSPWWLEDGANVWQGLATHGPPAVAADLSVSIEDVCVSDCAGDAEVTVLVGNTGGAALDGGVAVLLKDTSGEILGTTTLAETLDSGVGCYAVFTVSASSLSGGFRAEVSPVEAADECELTENTATWSEAVCP